MKVEAQPTAFPETIDLNSSDEDLLHYVSHRKNGDPLPQNVIMNVDPFSIEPLDADAHGENWYLCGFQEFDYAKGGKVRATGGGYWKQKGNDEQIHVNSQANGRKVYWEFFRGNEPYGSRTAWMILEYHSKYKEIQDENDKQDFNSLCRIYSSNSDEPCAEERCNNIDLDENAALDLETTLLNIGNAEDNLKSESTNESQVSDKKTPLLSTERCNLDNAVNSQGYDDCNEDYLTIDEIFDEIPSRSSFENSSRYSADDYFDSAMLLALVGEGNALTGQEPHAEGNAPDNLPRSDRHVENEPLSPEGAQSNGAEEAVPSQGTSSNRTPSPGLSAGASANLFRTLAMCIPSSSSNREGNRRQKRAASRSSDGSASSSSRDSGSGRSPWVSRSPPSDSQSGKSSSGSRMKSLGKKYCCLGPF